MPDPYSPAPELAPVPVASALQLQLEHTRAVLADEAQRREAAQAAWADEVRRHEATRAELAAARRRCVAVESAAHAVARAARDVLSRSKALLPESEPPRAPEQTASGPVIAAALGLASEPIDVDGLVRRWAEHRARSDAATP